MDEQSVPWTVADQASVAFRAPKDFVPVLTDTESTVMFFGQTVQLIARLGDHLRRLDDGVPHALDDLAVVMRALVSRANGNNMLKRLHKAVGSPPVEILLSRPPYAKKGVTMSWGSVPVTTAQSELRGARWVPVERWVQQPVLVTSNAGRPDVKTWAEFADRYANKWGGAHFDKKGVPASLQNAEAYEVGGYTLSGYLMRTAGVQAWFISQYLLMGWFRKLRPDVVGELPHDAQPWVQPHGGVGGPPVDRRHHGDVVYFQHSDRGSGCEVYIAPGHAGRFVFRLGSIEYEMVVSNAADGDESPVPVETLRQRKPIYKGVDLDPATVETSTFEGFMKAYDPDETLGPFTGESAAAEPSTL